MLYLGSSDPGQDGGPSKAQRELCCAAARKLGHQLEVRITDLKFALATGLSTYKVLWFARH